MRNLFISTVIFLSITLSLIAEKNSFKTIAIKKQGHYILDLRKAFNK
ncbi:MAG: hypothetical protein U9O87_08030 [Verrucomicrobiota bacterium]|nr:hypothetical protein [Verrucomicrobiota bacterium]